MVTADWDQELVVQESAVQESEVLDILEEALATLEPIHTAAAVAVMDTAAVTDIQAASSKRLKAFR